MSLCSPVSEDVLEGGLKNGTFLIKSLSFSKELQNLSIEFRETISEMYSQLIAPSKIESFHNRIVCQSRCNCSTPSAMTEYCCTFCTDTCTASACFKIHPQP